MFSNPLESCVATGHLQRHAMSTSNVPRKAPWKPLTLPNVFPARTRDRVGGKFFFHLSLTHGTLSAPHIHSLSWLSRKPSRSSPGIARSQPKSLYTPPDVMRSVPFRTMPCCLRHTQKAERLSARKNLARASNHPRFLVPSSVYSRRVLIAPIHTRKC
jgi:hypothetical protein